MNRNIRFGLSALVIGTVVSMAVGGDGCDGSNGCNIEKQKCYQEKQPDTYEEQPSWMNPYTLWME